MYSRELLIANENVGLKNKVSKLTSIIEIMLVDNQKLLEIGSIIHKAPFELSAEHKIELIEKILKGE